MSYRRCIVPLLAALPLAGPALAQETDSPLAGPEVETREVPGVREAYRPGEVAGLDDADRAVPLNVYFRTLRELAATEHALTPEQALQVRDEVRRYGQELAAFLEVHGPELRELVGQLPREQRGRAAAEISELGRLGQMLERIERSGGVLEDDRTDRPRRRDREARRDAEDRSFRIMEAEEDDGFRLDFRERTRRSPETPTDESMRMDEPMRDAMSPDAPAADSDETAGGARARLIELRNLAPSIAALEIRIWELLSEPQQDVVGEAVEEFLTAQRDRIQEARLQREIERREAEAKARREQSDRAFDFGDATRQRVLAVLESGEIPDRLWERLPDRMRERLESLPEDERAAALARLLRARERRESDQP